jgi:hypothetical protein
LVTPGDSIFVNHAEGRAAYRLYDENGNYLPGWYYEYTLRDHLGTGGRRRLGWPFVEVE